MSTKNISNKKIFFMSLPIFVELFLQLLVGNVDQIMLSRFSEGAVAAIGNSNQIINLTIVILTMLSSAVLVLLTHYIGADDKKNIDKTVAVAFALILGVSVLVGVLLAVFGRPLLRALNAPEEIIAEAYTYLWIVAGALFAQGFYFVVAAILRSYGRLKEVMISAAVMNIINIIGNYILINGVLGFPRLGIVGAAISTDLSKCIGLGIALLFMLRKTPVKLSFKAYKPFPFDALKQLLHIGVPTGSESASYNVSQIVILSFINLFGTAVIATKVYCSMFANVAYLYSIAIAQATQIAVGYMVGAGEYDKIQNRVMRTTYVCIGVSVSVSLLLYFFSDSVFGLFTADKAILSLGKKILLIEVFLEIGRSVNIVMTRCLATLNDIYFPVVSGVLSQWLVAVLLGYILSLPLGLGLIGIWIAMTADECLRGALFVIRFYKRGWLKGHEGLPLRPAKKKMVKV